MTEREKQIKIALNWRYVDLNFAINCLRRGDIVSAFEKLKETQTELIQMRDFLK